MKKDKKQNSDTAVDSNKDYNINYSVEKLEKIQRESESKRTKNQEAKASQIQIVTTMAGVVANDASVK